MTDKRAVTCCFTGHRKLPTGQYQMIADRLEQTIIRLIEKGVLYFGAGGALGFDTLAALTVLRLRKQYPQIKLILVLPCRDQTRGWSKYDVSVYETIKAQCNKYVYVSEQYTKGCMFARNRHLVDNSAYCVCYLTEEHGGTYYTVSYAKDNGLQVFNLA